MCLGMKHHEGVSRKNTDFLYSVTETIIFIPFFIAMSPNMNAFWLIKMRFYFFLFASLGSGFFRPGTYIHLEFVG